MKTAIYCRKSIYSDKSDSVKNQEQMCMDFVNMRFNGAEFSVYTDEGFTGANTNRPHLNRLICDIRQDKIECLVVYQLDRLSRSVKDFATIYDILEEHSVTFLSLKENLDTSTPIGKAMMYITMVFAQMERETIAERVTDNMKGLAKQGFWTGGKPPIGYRAEKAIIDGKKHSVIVPDNPQYVQNIFADFLENNWSLTAMQTAYKHDGIRTVNGAFFSTSQLHKVLSNPYYVTATEKVFDYFKSLGCIMADSRSEWDGSSGVMVYGRSTEKNKKHELQPPGRWIVCKGIHEPIIDAETWLNAQKRLKKNIFNKQGKYPPPLLKGVLRCKECGCLMQVSRKHYNGKLISYYYCNTRAKQGNCTMSQIRCDKLDDLVIEEFKRITLDDSVIEKYLPQKTEQKTDLKKLEKQIASKEKQINNLMESLAEATPTARNRLISALNKLDKEITELNGKMEICRSEAHQILDSEQKKEDAVEAIKDIVRNIDRLSPEALNRIAKEVIVECTFDGKELFLCL